MRSALHISHFVYGRKPKGHRVTYLVDPKGRGTERAIPETVVLRRWRMRGDCFSGARLRSTLWRALPVALGPDVRKWPTRTEAHIRRALAAKRKLLRERRHSAPAAEIVWSLLQVCPVPLLNELIARHKSLGKMRRSGVPDLFLFARCGKGKPYKVRFVEVKKPKERVSQDQHDELTLLQRHNLSGRVLRLIERELPRTRAK